MGESPNSVVAQLRSGMCPPLHSAERRVADCILADIRRASVATSAELSRMSGASEATITRLCHKLGFENYRRFQLGLARDVLDMGEDTGTSASEDPVQRVTLEGIAARTDELQLLVQNLDMEKLRCAVDVLDAAGVIEIAAAGCSLSVALDISIRLSSLGKRCLLSTLSEKTLAVARTLTGHDALLVIAESGRNTVLEQTVRLAQERGAAAIVITRDRRSPLARLANYLFLTPRRVVHPGEDNCTPSQLSTYAFAEMLYYLMVNRRHEAPAGVSENPSPPDP